MPRSSIFQRVYSAVTGYFPTRSILPMLTITLAIQILRFVVAVFIVKAIIG